MFFPNLNFNKIQYHKGNTKSVKIKLITKFEIVLNNGTANSLIIKNKGYKPLSNFTTATNYIKVFWAYNKSNERITRKNPKFTHRIKGNL